MEIVQVLIFMVIIAIAIVQQITKAKKKWAHLLLVKFLLICFPQ